MFALIPLLILMHFLENNVFNLLHGVGQQILLACLLKTHDWTVVNISRL